MSDIEASKLAAIQAHAGVRHSQEVIDEALKQIGEKAAYLLTFGPEIENAVLRDVFDRGLLFIGHCAKDALLPVTFCDPPDNGIFTSPGEMAGNPSLNDQNEHHTRKL